MDLSQTTVVASYWTRRDAEIARDYLEEDGIRAFIQSDDAGGMHPQMQWSQGVHLVVLGSEAQRAYEALQEAELLPQSGEDDDSDAEDPAANATESSGIRALLLIFAVLAVMMALGLLWWFG